MLECRVCKECIQLTDTKRVTPGGNRITIVTCKIYNTFEISTLDNTPCIEERIDKRMM